MNLSFVMEGSQVWMIDDANPVSMRIRRLIIFRVMHFAKVPTSADFEKLWLMRIMRRSLKHLD